MEPTTEHMSPVEESGGNKVQLTERNRAFMVEQGFQPISPFNDRGQFVASRATGGYVVLKPDNKRKGGLKIGATLYPDSNAALAAIGLAGSAPETSPDAV